MQKKKNTKNPDLLDHLENYLEHYATIRNIGNHSTEQREKHLSWKIQRIFLNRFPIMFEIPNSEHSCERRGKSLFVLQRWIRYSECMQLYFCIFWWDKRWSWNTWFTLTSSPCMRIVENPQRGRCEGLMSSNNDRKFIKMKWHHRHKHNFDMV